MAGTSPAMTTVDLYPLDLPELQLHRRGAAETRHRDLDPGTAFVNLLHHAVQRGECPVAHPDLLADLEADRHDGRLISSRPARIPIPPVWRGRKSTPRP